MRTNVEITLSKIMAFLVFGWGVYSGKVVECLPFIVILVTGKQFTDWLKKHEKK
jgi:hypothetical protein